MELESLCDCFVKDTSWRAEGPTAARVCLTGTTRCWDGMRRGWDWDGTLAALSRFMCAPYTGRKAVPMCLYHAAAAFVRENP